MPEKIHDPTLDIKKPWWSLPAKITFIFAALAFTFMAVLSVMGGNSVALKETIENIVSSSTGYQAKINRFDGLEFFPTVKLDFADMELLNKDEEQVGRIEKFSIATSFWDVLFRTGRFSKLDVQNVHALPGVFSKQAIHLKSIDVKRDSEDQAILAGRAQIGNKPLDFTVDLDVLGKSPYFKYGFSNPRKVDITYGDFELTANMRDDGGLVMFDDLIFSHLDDAILNADVGVAPHDFKQVEFKGTLDLIEHGSILKPDVILDFSKERLFIRGHFSAPRIHAKDFGQGTKLSAAIDVLMAEFIEPKVENVIVKKSEPMVNTHEEVDPGDEIQSVEGQVSMDVEPIDLSFMDIDVSLDIEEFATEDLSLASLKGPLTMINGHLKANNLKGDLSGGRVTFNMDLDASKPLAILKTDLKVSKLDYAKLQSSLNSDVSASGFADISLDLVGEGVGEEALLKSLKGRFEILAQSGQMKTKALNLWGGGLVNALIPSIDPESETRLNCGVVQFDIDEGIAESENVFLDTKRVTVVGDGKYYIAEDKLNMKLKPQSKDVALVDIAPGVIVSGSLGGPSIKPSVVDLGAKVGGLLLSAVNPAALAISMTDLGRTENHPCAKFIEGYERPAEAETPESIEPQAGGLNE